MAANAGDSIDLVMRSRKPPAIHGENGVSVKAEGVGYASHYYSMTRLEVTGTLNRQRCHGLAWMDHEFGSSNLRQDQQVGGDRDRAPGPLQAGFIRVHDVVP